MLSVRLETSKGSRSESRGVSFAFVDRVHDICVLSWLIGLVVLGCRHRVRSRFRSQWAESCPVAVEGSRVLQVGEGCRSCGRSIVLIRRDVSGRFVN